MDKTIKNKTEWLRSPDFLAVLALFALSFFFFYDLFFDGPFFTLFNRHMLVERDLGPYFIPPRFFWVESLKNGSFPLWNPYQFCGQPFFANPQHGMLYPLNALFFLFPFDIAFNGIIILHFFLGGLFTYLLLRDLKVQPAGAFISGIIFTFSGYLLSVHSLLTILLSSVWTPLIILFFRRAIHQRRSFKNELLTAIVITISFFGGGIEIVYSNFFVLLIMVIFSKNPPMQPVGDKPRHYKLFPISKLLGSVPIDWGRIKSLIIVSILFISFSAVQLFPFIELFHHSIRGKGIPYASATVWSVAPKDILLFFLPDAYGYFLDMKKYWVSQCWFKTLYTGGLPFILSLVYFFFRPKRTTDGPHGGSSDNEHLLFFVLILFSLFLSLGRYNPLYPLVFNIVPFFKGIRYPAKFLYTAILILSVTAGLGFQKISERSKESDQKRFNNLLILLSLACGVLLLSMILARQEILDFLKSRGLDYPRVNPAIVNFYNAGRFFFILALFFLLIRTGIEKRWKAWIKISLILLLIIDLFGNMGYYAKEKTEDFFKKNESLEKIPPTQGMVRLFSTEKTTSMDTTILINNPSPNGWLKEKNLPSMNLLYGLHDIWGIDVIRINRTDELYRLFTAAPSITTTHLLDLYGAKFITSVTSLENNRQFELIYAKLEGLKGTREELLKENTIKIYRNKNCLPRAWLVTDFHVMDPNALLGRMIQSTFRPDQEVFLEETPRWKNGPLRSSFSAKEKYNVRSSQKVKILSETNNRLVLQASADDHCLLFLSDTWYPGWKAFVDGKPEKIYRADYTFRAVPLQAGIHRVEFIYDPFSFKLGLGVTLMGIIGCVVTGLVRRKKS